MDLGSKTAVIYGRSAAETEEANGMNEQFAACSAYCAEHGFVVVGMYYESGISGLWTERPAELTKALAEIVGGDAVFFVCTDFERISRDASKLRDVMALIDRYGGELHTCTPSYMRLVSEIGRRRGTTR